MSQLQALGLVVAFMFALSLVVSVCVFITALVYEARDWAARRRRRAYLGTVTQAQAREEMGLPPLGDNQGVRVKRSNGRWAA